MTDSQYPIPFHCITGSQQRCLRKLTSYVLVPLSILGISVNILFTIVSTKLSKYHNRTLLVIYWKIGASRIASRLTYLFHITYQNCLLARQTRVVKFRTKISLFRINIWPEASHTSQYVLVRISPMCQGFTKSHSGRVRMDSGCRDLKNILIAIPPRTTSDPSWEASVTTSNYMLYRACTRVRYWARYNSQQSSSESSTFQRSSCSMSVSKSASQEVLS
jgi:hypothetical protein